MTCSTSYKFRDFYLRWIFVPVTIIGVGAAKKELNMRQRRWIELFSDYEGEIRYHLREANEVTNALREMSNVENVTAEMLRGMDQLIERKEDGADKMYYDLRDMYGGHVWRRILLPKLLQSSSEYDTNWIIVDRLTKVVIGKSSLIGPELVQETTDKVVLIKKKLKAASDCQKSYADNRRKHLEFEVGDQVLLEVLSWKEVVHFGKKEMLAPRYVGPFEIIKGIGPIAY
ncbi:hypothetical protein Tco_0410407 [Tanacetum coccineum]